MEEAQFKLPFVLIRETLEGSMREKFEILRSKLSEVDAEVGTSSKDLEERIGI